MIYNEVVRDVVYFFHLCSDYESIAYDIPLLLGTGGPYFEWLDNEDAMVAKGTVLIFLAMLIDWNDGSGFVFSSDVQPLGSYLERILDLYAKAKQLVNDSMCDLYGVIISMCGLLDSAKDFPTRFPDLDVELLNHFHEIVRADGLDRSEEALYHSFSTLYRLHVQPYFCERCSR